jgi:solute carrier family 25 (mitochondrial carnitine/acylcarnitine transporter), member 20/29
MLREFPSFAAYFGVYEALKRWLSPSGNPSPQHLLLVGGCAGIAAWLPCYPQDVVKSRWQSMRDVPTTTTPWTIARDMARQHGWRAFTRGLAPTLIRAFPANGPTFLAYEWMHAALSD